MRVAKILSALGIAFVLICHASRSAAEDSRDTLGSKVAGTNLEKYRFRDLVGREATYFQSRPKEPKAPYCS